MENEIKDMGKQSEDDSAGTGNGRCLVSDNPVDEASESSRDSLNKEVPEGDIRSLGNDEDDNDDNVLEIGNGDYEMNTPTNPADNLKNCTQGKDLNGCKRGESEIPEEGLVTGELENVQNPQTSSADDVKIGTCSQEEYLTDGDPAESKVPDGQHGIGERDNERNILTTCTSGDAGNVKYGSKNKVADDRKKGEGCGGPFITAREGDDDIVIGITQPSSKGVESGSQEVGVAKQGSEGAASGTGATNGVTCSDGTDASSSHVNDEIQRENCRSGGDNVKDISNNRSKEQKDSKTKWYVDSPDSGAKNEPKDENLNDDTDDKTAEERDGLTSNSESDLGSFEIIINIDEANGVEDVEEEPITSPEGCDKAEGCDKDDSKNLENSGDGSLGNERDSVDGSGEKKGAGLKSEEQEKQILPAMARPSSENEVGNERDSVDGSGEKEGAGLKLEKQEKPMLPAMARPTSENEVGNGRYSVEGSGEKEGAGLKSEEQEKQILPAMARPSSENEAGNERDSFDESGEKEGAGLKTEKEEKQILWPAMPTRPSLENEVGNGRDSVDGSEEKKGAGLKSEEQEKQILPAMARPTSENEVRDLSLHVSDDSVAPLDVIPSTHDTCVATVMSKLTDGLCFAELCSNIGELGRYLHIGTSIVADTATLLVKVQNALFEVIRLCDAVSLLLQNLRVSSNNIIEKLKIAFLYLLDGFPEFAKTNIEYISKDVKTMQVKSSKCLDVIGNLKDLLNENGTLQKEWTKKYEEVQVRFSKEPALFEAVIYANTGFTVIVPEKPVPLESSPDEDGAEVATDASGSVKQPDEKKPTEMGGVIILSETAGSFQRLPLNDTAVDEVTVDLERPSPLASSSPDEDGGEAATYGNGTTTCMKQPDERKRMEYGEVSKVRKLWGKINPWQFFGSKDKEEVPNRSTNTSSTKSDSLETTLEQERETLRDARRLHDFSNRLLLLRDALFTSLDTLNNIETTIKGTARLVDTWDVECKSVIEPWMAKEFETTQNLTPEDQAKYWKSLWFQKQAREYYNRWCALGAYCEVNTVALKKTRKEVDALYTENLLPREAIENAWRLAEGMDDDKIKKIVEKHNKEQMNK